jgi:hypothetical protein
MGNGFIVTIENNTNTAQEIKLFSGILPEGVSLSTMDKAYNFDALKIMAQNNVFIGNSITTGLDEGIQIEIVNNNQIEKIILNGRYERPKIRINGDDEFILIMCPANSKFYIRLNTLPPETI